MNVTKASSISLVLVSVLIAIVSCSDRDPPAASSGGSSGPGPVDSSCTPGSVVACGDEIRSDDHFIYCYEGFKTCGPTGTFGACAEGTIATRARRGDLHTLGLGTATDCGSLNPCDPDCSAFVDTAPGITSPGFVSLDGGITTGLLPEVCGNGTKAGSEGCDDGNTTNGDGCSSSCRIEAGFQCLTPGSPCTVAVCGNGVLEGIEQCDDGNIRPYDGCSPTCAKDFNCPVGAPCTAVCGDGLKFPSENCDDGNTTNGDGCSSTCTVELGASCITVTAPAPAFIDVPIIYRDFKPDLHPDFEFVPTSGGGLPHGFGVGGPPYCPGQVAGIPAANLAADGKPEFGSRLNCVGDANSFRQWYRDTPGVNRTIVGKYLRLANDGSGNYVFNSDADPAYNLPNINCGNLAGPTTRCKNNYAGFFPINTLGWGDYSTTGKNFHFTSEVRYPFTYAGGEVLSFSGDDDVFVYVAGKKVVDLGGFHGVALGSVTLANSMNTVAPSTPFTLVPGNTYEIDVFQAERHVTGSNYKLTLRGFNRQISQCTPPPSSTTFVRDFEAVCAPGSQPVWQLFQWKAGIPAGAAIAFRAATADTQAALPASPPAASPTTIPIGTATSANSPTSPLAFRNDTNVGPPVSPRPVSQSLAAVNLSSKRWLRVYMSFSGVSPILYQWQQLYDCVATE